MNQGKGRRAGGSAGKDNSMPAIASEMQADIEKHSSQSWSQKLPVAEGRGSCRD